MKKRPADASSTDPLDEWFAAVPVERLRLRDAVRREQRSRDVRSAAIRFSAGFSVLLLVAGVATWALRPAPEAWLPVAQVEDYVSGVTESPLAKSTTVVDEVSED